MKIHVSINSRGEKPNIGFINCGFPSPADDHLDEPIDLNKEYAGKDSIFFGRVRGDSMNGACLHEGDLLIIDKSLKPTNGRIAVCFVDGDFTVKRIKIENKVVWLLPENRNYQPLKITPDNEFMIWGIVKNIIKDV